MGQDKRGNKPMDEETIERIKAHYGVEDEEQYYSPEEIILTGDVPIGETEAIYDGTSKKPYED